jgi:hypothetical protein
MRVTIFQKRVYLGHKHQHQKLVVENFNRLYSHNQSSANKPKRAITINEIAHKLKESAAMRFDLTPILRTLD